MARSMLTDIIIKDTMGLSEDDMIELILNWIDQADGHHPYYAQERVKKFLREMQIDA